MAHSDVLLSIYLCIRCSTISLYSHHQIMVMHDFRVPAIASTPCAAEGVRQQLTMPSGRVALVVAAVQLSHSVQSNDNDIAALTHADFSSMHLEMRASRMARFHRHFIGQRHGLYHGLSEVGALQT